MNSLAYDQAQYKFTRIIPVFKAGEFTKWLVI